VRGARQPGGAPATTLNLTLHAPRCHRPLTCHR
jgi:hypothetical protein